MKYEITNIKHESLDLYRIRALKDFGDVKVGDLGGFIKKESNLSQEGNAWVYDNARVFGNAQVFDNAQVSGDARVYENAQVSVDARVYGNAWVSGDARVYDNARVFGNARVSGDVRVRYNSIKNDISLRENLIENIEAQTGLKVFNSEVYCYKHVDDDLSSLHDNTFIYKINE